MLRRCLQLRFWACVTPSDFLIDRCTETLKGNDGDLREMKEGMRFMNSGKFSRAIKPLERAHEIFSSIGEPVKPLLNNVIVLLGQCHMFNKNNDFILDKGKHFIENPHTVLEDTTTLAGAVLFSLAAMDSEQQHVVEQLWSTALQSNLSHFLPHVLLAVILRETSHIDNLINNSAVFDSLDLHSQCLLYFTKGCILSAAKQWQDAVQAFLWAKTKLETEFGETYFLDTVDNQVDIASVNVKMFDLYSSVLHHCANVYYSMPPVVDPTFQPMSAATEMCSIALKITRFITEHDTTNNKAIVMLTLLHRAYCEMGMYTYATGLYNTLRNAIGKAGGQQQYPQLLQLLETHLGMLEKCQAKEKHAIEEEIADLKGNK